MSGSNVGDEGSILDQAIEQIHDKALRARIAREVELLRGSRRFGLVFDRHLPESVRLPDHPIRKGVSVALRDESTSQRWRVLRFADSARSVAVLDGDGGEVPTSRLVAIREFGEPVYPGLRSVERITRGPADAPCHVVINGENFHALQALRATRRGEVDLIYIDPPYNTGGKTSWLYNDRFVDRSDRSRSSKWLSFMERRLLIARDLLKPSGAIFVSIGDDEQHRLRLLLDQVFGVENCVATLAIEMSTTSGPKTVNAQQGTIVKNIEYVQVYRKSERFDQVIAHTPLLDSISEWDTHYSLWLNENGTLGQLGSVMLADQTVGAEIAKLDLAPRGKFSMKSMDQLLAVSEAARNWIVSNLDRIARTDRAPISANGRQPAAGHFEEFQTKDRTYLLTTLANGTLQQIVPLALNYRTSDDYRPRFGRTVIRGDLWKGFHQDMGNIAREGGVNFGNGKKPIRLIKQLIRWANNSPDAVVVDFFGGSGTTVHAVAAMNAEDQGRRQCILVTNNELGIDTAKSLRARGLRPGDREWEGAGVFEAVTRPRIYTVITGKRPDGSHYSDGLAANVEMFDLTYLDPGTVRRGREFAAIAPLMWIEGGATGDRISDEPDAGWALTPFYGVLVTIDALAPFADAVAAAATDGCAPTVVFVVTDSPTEYQQAVERLPIGVETVQLYEDYLANYTINVERGAR